tara:strand:+ start:13252 stop:13707 length:456 start_codon:yes stop_codon:yes gene_type:complete
MKSFLEHTRDQQEEGALDSVKKGLRSAGGAIMKKVKGDGKKKEKGPGMMDKIKAGAKRVVQAVGREFQKGKDAAKAERPPKDKKAKQQAKVDKGKELGISELEPTDNKVDATGDAFEKKSKDAKIKKKEDEREEEQRRLEAGYAPLPVDQR